MKARNTKNSKTIAKKKKATSTRPSIRSRHPSHDILRRANRTLPLFKFKSLVRLGSTTELKETFLKDRVVLNTVEAIKNSSNKLRMKRCFAENEVKTAQWWTYGTDNTFLLEGQAENESVQLSDLPFPIISKHVYGSRGRGNVKHDNAESLLEWLTGKTLSNYIFEKFHNYNREYRLHVSKNGCFYTCRKMLRTGTPDDERWFRNDSNSVWIREENPSFDIPVNWDYVVEQSVKALKAVGLDFGAVDLRIQSATNRDGERRDNPEFIVVEINSAPSFGAITAEKYIEEIPKLLIDKYEETR